MNISDEIGINLDLRDDIGSDLDLQIALIVENNAEPSEFGGSSTQEFHASVEDNGRSVSTLEQLSHTCINEQTQSTIGKYFYVQRSNNNKLF